MTDRAERQVGERLSEQARLEELLNDYRHGHGMSLSSDDGHLIFRAYLSQARQLAEAERYKQAFFRVLAALEVSDVTGAEHEIRRLRSNAERYREALARIVQTGGSVDSLHIARAALSPPDSPASPAEGPEAVLWSEGDDGY